MLINSISGGLNYSINQFVVEKPKSEINDQKNILELKVHSKTLETERKEYFEVYHKYVNWTETPGSLVLIRAHPNIPANAPVLLKAVAASDYYAAELFLKNNADPQLSIRDGVGSFLKPLEFAVSDDNEEMVKLLLSYIPEEKAPLKELFIGSSLCRCKQQIVKMLFEKTGGVERYLELYIEDSNKRETKYRPRITQHVVTPYGKCSNNTYDVLQAMLLYPISQKVYTDATHKYRDAGGFPVIQYLIENGWPLNICKILQFCLQKNAPINVFQAIQDRGYEIPESRILLGLLVDSFHYDGLRWDVLELFLERNPNLLKENVFGQGVGRKIAERHEIERYQWAISLGVKPDIDHLRQAILNISILEKNQSQYLSFIQWLLGLGIDPNCLLEAKMTGCRALIELLLEFGAKPI